MESTVIRRPGRSSAARRSDHSFHGSGKDHLVSILHTRDGRFVDNGVELAAVLERLDADPTPRLLLHVHGGLVSYPKALEIADRLDGMVPGKANYTPLKNAGWQTSYLAWESSVAESIGNNHDELSRNPLLVRYILRLAAWIERRGWETLAVEEEDLAAVRRRLDEPPPPAGALYIAIGPDASKVEEAEALDTDQLLDTDLGRQILNDPGIERFHTEIVGEPGKVAPGRDIDPEVLARIAARSAHPSPLLPNSRGSSAADFVLVPLLVLAGLRAIKRLVTDRDHGVYCTLVEEIARVAFVAKCGASDWAMMKQDTLDHFDHGAGGNLLLEGLTALARTRPVRVLLVGHSAGAVFGCHFAEQASALPGNVTVDYAFLNPAVRIDQMASSLVQKPRRLDNIRVFTMTDEREKKDDLDGNLFGKIYPRSLLYLISGVLEFLPDSGRTYPDAPISGLQRHLRRQATLTRTERAARDALLGLIEPQIVYAGVDGGDGRRCDATTHGSIDEDRQTIESIIHLGLTGY
ncbi:hypothetical protein [Brevundimonas sp.]|uniref:hypothetical protein n=1 Tax=Brevundimonas sp. TaxID=1871086 RepID=UPI003D13A12F